MASTSLPLRRTSSLDTTILRSLQIDDVDSSNDSEREESEPTLPRRPTAGMLMTRWNSLFHKKEDGIDLTRISQPMPELTTAPLVLAPTSTAATLKRSPTLPAYAKAKDLNREPEPKQVATDYALEDRLASRFDWSPPTSPEPSSSKRRLPALKTSSARASSDYTPSPRQLSRVSRDAASSSNSSRPSSSSKSMDFGSRVSVPPTPPLALPTSPRRPTQAPPISQSSKARTRRSIISAPQSYLEELPDFAPPRRAPVPPLQTSTSSMPRSKSHDGARIVYPQPRRAPTALRPPSETLSLSNFDFELPSLMATDEDRLLAMGSRDSSSKPASPRRGPGGHSRTPSSVSDASANASSPRRARGSKPSSPKRHRSRALPASPTIGARVSSRPQHRRTASATTAAATSQVEEPAATTPPLVWASVKSPALNASPALPTRSPLRERRKLGLGADGQPLVLTALPKSARPRSAGATGMATPPPMPPPTGPLPEVPSYFDMADQYLSGNDTLMRQSVIPPSTSTAPDLDSLLRPSNRLRSDSASVYSLPSPAAAHFPLPPASLPTRGGVLSPVQEQTAPVVAGSIRAARRPSTADAALPGMEILTVATSPRRKPQGPRPDSTSSFSSTSPSSYTSTYSSMGRHGAGAGRNRASILSNGSGSSGSGSGSAQSRMSITSPFSGGSSTSGGTLGPATPPSHSAAVGAGAVSFSASPPTASSLSPRGLGLSLGPALQQQQQQQQADPWPRVSSPAMSTFTTGSGGSGGGYVSARSSTSTMLLFEALRLDMGADEQKKGTTTAMGRSRSALATGTVYGQGDEDGDEQTVWPASAGARYGFAM